MTYSVQVNFEKSYIQQEMKIRPMVGELIEVVPDPRNPEFDYESTYLINHIKINQSPEMVDLILYVTKHSFW